MGTIKLRVTHALWFKGAAYPIGATIETTARDASALVDSGRAVLCDPSAVPAIKVARREELDDALRVARRQVVETAPPAGWWPTRRAG